ncbi:hypothetical protein NQ317_015570 [Molorchus minor]|uniref:C2H2-type domain-containing protein n=1 Tax=Molorchus minor TaxID=1323400 RepID=A0ABQ9JIE0_9CUCU|nr:hypothetical protein NQ317_015570 [Molorchus minor]
MRKILLLREPTDVCLECFDKLNILKIYFYKALIRNLNGKMRSERQPLSTENDEEKTEEEKKEQEEQNPKVEHAHDYTCLCEACQSKYGSLPLLLQVIEQKSQMEKTESSPQFEPQPSTSSSQEPQFKTSKKVLVCQYCKKNFTHRGDYNKHLRKHTKEQPFTCQICKRKFAHTSNLQRHYRLHSGQRPFVCANCDKKFSRKDKLESHMRSKFCKKSHSS